MFFGHSGQIFGGGHVCESSVVVGSEHVLHLGQVLNGEISSLSNEHEQNNFLFIQDL